MNKKRELAKNTIIILLGKISTQFLSYFLLPLYTSVLTSSEYGIVDLITTYVALAVPLISLQIESGVFRELIDCRNNGNKKEKVISSGFFAIIIQFIIVLIVYITLSTLVKIPFKNYIVLCTFSTMISNFLLQVVRGNGDNLNYSIASVIAGVSTLILNLIFLKICNLKIEGMLLASFLGNFLAILYLLFINKLIKYINLKSFSKVAYNKLLRYSLPLVPNGLIWWIINVSDRTIISIFLSVSSNGIYAVSNKFSNALIQIYNVFNLSWTESASLHINDNDKDEFFSDTFSNILTFFILICTLIIIVMPLAFNFLVDSKFAEAYKYIPILFLGSLFNIIVSFIGGVYVALRKTKEVALTSLWSGIINIIINLLLVHKIKIYAAALSTVLAFAIMSIFRLIDIQKYIKLKIKTTRIITPILLFVVSVILYYFHNKIISIIWLNVVILVLLIFYKSFFLSVLKQRHSKEK